MKYKVEDKGIKPRFTGWEFRVLTLNYQVPMFDDLIFIVITRLF